MKNPDGHKENGGVRGIDIKKNKEGFSLSLSNNAALYVMLSIMFVFLMLILTPGGIELIQTILNKIKIR